MGREGRGPRRSLRQELHEVHRQRGGQEARGCRSETEIIAARSIRVAGGRSFGISRFFVPGRHVRCGRSESSVPLHRSRPSGRIGVVSEISGVPEAGCRSEIPAARRMSGVFFYLCEKGRIVAAPEKYRIHEIPTVRSLRVLFRAALRRGAGFCRRVGGCALRQWRQRAAAVPRFRFGAGI